MSDIAHLGHVEVYTDKFDESLEFFTRVYGLKLSLLEGDSAYLRAWDDYEFHSLKLTRHQTTGVGHIGYRASSSEALERRAKAITDAGYKVHGWNDGDAGHERAFRFEDPFGHIFEIYYDTCLGSQVTEMIQLDNGRIGGCWFTVNNKTYDLACTEEHGRGTGRLHHITYATDQREDILRAADIFLENGVHIETGPHKHAIQGTFFLYVWEPAGNRVELANAGARLILAPDHEPVVWTEAERKKGQAWGLKTIDTFHTHGTPPVKDAR
jgi:catechol 2,3-dioxygenase